MLAERYPVRLTDIDALGTVDSLSASPMRSYLMTKRAFDVVFAALALVLLSPVFLAIAILIKLTSDGEVFYSQVRCGQSARLFQCYKFRTMVPNATWILENDDLMRASYTHQWKLTYDPRITKFGKLLRKTSLDELPQLWNVLKGEMSIVGPRPVQPVELREQYASDAPLVTMARPGMTGLWQISGRSTLTYEQRVAIDVDYVRRRSVWFDLLIIVRTVPALLLARGAQ